MAVLSVLSSNVVVKNLTELKGGIIYLGKPFWVPLRNISLIRNVARLSRHRHL